MMNPNDNPSHKGYAPFPTTIPPYVGAVIFETFLYGLYTVLCGICFYVLLRRNRSLHWILLASAFIMYLLATADIAYTYYLLFSKLLKGGVSFTNLRPKYWLYVTNNVLADSLLLYRCYVVWHFKKRIIAGPLVLLLAGTISGYLLEGSESSLFAQAWVYLIMTLVLNLILTGLTAGRIWWLAREAKQILGTGLLDRYNATIAILIESGFIYSLYIVLNLALYSNKVGNLILDAGLIQIVGIMPTLIIVQVGLGRAVHDIEANDPLARHEATSASSKIQIQTPTRSSFNRSYPDGIGIGIGGLQGSYDYSNGSIHRALSSHKPLTRHNQDACCRAPCSASSETFVMRHHRHNNDHEDEQDVRDLESEVEVEMETPDTRTNELPEISSPMSDMGLMLAQPSNRLERDPRDSERRIGLDGGG